ncbi:MAG: sulfurtransferase [Spiribacter salinus]|uniref:Sulfurtransferase n=1 Tax=Spiribacter salinus TaxID=1335746 RepID=A0A540VUN0_9GAMM|nr:MAG: sulfurtransferase [Spiribacter salinus]
MRISALTRNALAGLALALPALVIAQPGPVVDAQWVLENRDDVVVINASRRPSNYEDTGFIADAPFVGMGEFLTERPGMQDSIRYLVPSASDFEGVMQGLGVDADDQVVIVPAGDAIYGDATVASRLYWQMRYYGHEDVAILDGGVAAWSVAGGETSRSPASSPGGGSFSAEESRDDLLATTDEVEAVIAGETSATLVDNRPLPQFTGVVSKDYVDGRGHLPEAEPLPFNLFVAPRDGIVYWRSPEAVQNIVSAMLPLTDGPIIDYCNSGHVSSLAWFGMSEIGGMSDVALYDGSLHEWTLDGDRSLIIGR